MTPLPTSDRRPRFSDLGAMKESIKELTEHVLWPFLHPEHFRELGLMPIAPLLLLYGLSGCGKTRLAHAIGNEANIPFYEISAAGASEENIRDLFLKAYQTVPSIIFIDDIDAIASKGDDLEMEMKRKSVIKLMTSMEDSQTMGGSVLVIGATSRPEAINRDLMKCKRFLKEIELIVPDENGRVEILSLLTRNIKLEANFDLFMIAKRTPGFVGGDLEALVNEARRIAMNKISRKRSQLAIDHEKNVDLLKQPFSPEEIENLWVTMADFEEASKIVQLSTRREGFSSIPNITWEDVGGLDSLRQAFTFDIIDRIKYPEIYEKLFRPGGNRFLLYGPPGCGKTLIVKALANESGANFIHIKGLDKYVEGIRQEIRKIFSRAKTCSPCIVFFDEIDTLATRGEGALGADWAFYQLLAELDYDQRHGVYVIGATNRLDLIDPALLRPDRFGKPFYVPLPTAEEQVLILKALTRKRPVSPSIDFNALVRREACMNLSGADLADLVNEAAMALIHEKEMCIHQGNSYDEPLELKTIHLEKALEKITPSITEEQRQSKKYRAS